MTGVGRYGTRRFGGPGEGDQADMVWSPASGLLFLLAAASAGWGLIAAAGYLIYRLI